VWPFDRVPKSVRGRLQAVKDLGDLGETQAARARYRVIARRVERALPPLERARFLQTVAEATGEYNALFKRARTEFGGRMGGVPTPDSAPYWAIRYPRAERPLVVPLAARFDMPELWTYAIMRQESRYDGRQVSHTAALGIMQMIPATAKIVSRALDVPFHVETFFDPGRNVLFCMYYLAELLRDFKGQIVFASAAYNAGAPPIKRFLAAHRGRPFDEMVEFIPYNEGRNYARKVAEHLTRYAYLHLDPEARAALYRQLFPTTVDYDLGTAVDY
jgi:soluble lytic murein transglycosylase